jgi:diacylglycerol kinase (ATP)
MRVGILHNPLSGRNKRKPNLFQDVLSQHPDVSKAEIRSPSDILKALRTFAQEQVDCVAINGGDGTIQATMGTLFHHRPFTSMPSLAVLPAGTANLIAGDVGLGEFEPNSLEQLLADGKSSPSKLSIESRPILRVCFPEEREPLYGMFFGAGAIYHGTQMGLQTKQSIGRLGEWGAGLILIKFLLALATGSRKGLNPIGVRITAGLSSPTQEEYLLLMVTTLNRLFLGMKPFWANSSGPLRFTSLRVPYRYLWRVLPALLRGKSHALATVNHGYVSENFSEIRLSFESGFVLDGEVYTSSKPQEPLILDSPGELSFVRLKSG